MCVKMWILINLRDLRRSTFLNVGEQWKGNTHKSMNCKVCSNGTGRNSVVSYFRFPSDSARCREWAIRCNLLHLYEKHGPSKFYKSFRICSDHFDINQIQFDGNRKKLMKNAVPVAEKLDVELDSEAAIKMKLLGSLCRFCAEESTDLIEIHSWKGKTLDLEEKIKLFPIDIKNNDQLPMKVCPECAVKISKFYDFVKNCKKAEMRLKTILGISAEAEIERKQGDEYQQIKPSENSSKFTCNVCFKGFTSSEVFESHLKAHSLQPDENGRFICQTCCKVFPNKFRLNEHTRIHTGEYPYECSTCNKKFHKMALLKQHSAIHESSKRFFCSLCNQRSRRKGNLIQHLKTHSKGRNRLSDEVYTRKGLDHEHLTEKGEIMKKGSLENMGFEVGFNLNLPDMTEASGTYSALPEVQEDKSIYECKECTKDFKSKRLLRQHMKIHVGERIHVCGKCGIGFKRKDTLRNHLRIHTGERPFVCKNCGFAFKQKGDCVKHERNHRNWNEESTLCRTGME